MIKIYLKQAWALIREERLFSAIYIVGTGLAITLVMVLSIVFYIKVAPVYPELNRERTLSLRFGAVEHEGRGMNSGPISRMLVRECVEGTEGLEAVALTRDLTKSAFVQPDGSSVQLPAMRMAVDGAFWRVFSFRFVEGKPFGEAEARAGMPVAVIARSLARRLFSDAEVVGRTISVDFEPFRVVGVVRTPLSCWRRCTRKSGTRTCTTSTSGGSAGRIATTPAWALTAATRWWSGAPRWATRGSVSASGSTASATPWARA